MADTFTTNLNLTKPEPGSAEDTWGISLNSDLDVIDAIFGSGGTAVSMGAVTADSLTVDTSTLVVDATNNRVGIGISSPQGQLHINTESAEATKVYVDGEANQQKSLEIRHYNASEGSGVGRNLFYLKTPANDRLDIGGFTDGSSEFQVMTLMESGSVGIGTTSPDAPLVVQESSISQSAQANDIAVFERNATGYIKIYTPATATGGLAFGDAADPFVGAIRYEHSSNNMNFFVNNSERARLDSSGRLGLGTTSPDMGIHLSSTGTNYLRVTNTTTGVDSDFGTSSTGTEIINRQAAPIRFQTNATEAMRIDSSQRVGIGTTSPSQKLHVVGDVLIEEGSGFPRITLKDSDGTNTQGFLDHSGGDLGFTAQNGTSHGRIRFKRYNGTTTETSAIIDTSGNFGIGTTSPKTDLDVVRGGTTGLSAVNARTVALFQNNSSAGSVISVNAPNTGYSGIFLGDPQNEAQGQIKMVHTDNTMQFTASGSTSAMTIDSSQRVGIGTTSPTSPLTVKSSSVSASNSGILIQANGNTNNIIAMGEKSTDGGRFHMYDGGVEKIAFYTDGTANHISAGNLGIGTTSPNYPLTVHSTGDGIKFEVSDTVDANFRIQVSGNDIITGSSTASDYIFQTGNTERMRLTSTGLGIGTSSPDSNVKLDLNSGTNNVALGVESTDSNVFIAFKDSGTTGTFGSAAVAVGANSDNLLFRAGSAERARIDSSGNLLVGRTGASGLGKLNVEGGADFTGGNVLLCRDSGRVGIGTSSPSAPLHVVGNSYVQSGTLFTDAISAYSGSSVNINAGSSHFNVTVNGSERARIDSSGRLLLNTTSVDGMMRIDNAGQTTQTLLSLKDSGGTGTHTQIQFENTNGVVGNINTSGTSTAYNTSSDARLKDVTGEARGLDVINALNPVSYNWKADGKADEGLIAQEVAEIVPNAVSQNEEEYYQMDYSKLVVHLVKGMKEQQEQIEALQSEINLLKGE
jgi:hypothetical protein